MKALRHSENNLLAQGHEAFIKSRGKIWTQTCQPPTLERSTTVAHPSHKRESLNLSKEGWTRDPDSRLLSVPLPVSSPRWFWKHLKHAFCWVNKTLKLNLAHISQLNWFHMWFYCIYVYLLCCQAPCCALYIHKPYYLLSNPKINLSVSN